MAVPNTNTFSLQDVVNEINPTTNDLVDCFADAVASKFDSDYSGSKNSLLNFRNYGAVTGYTINFYIRDVKGDSDLNVGLRYYDSNGGQQEAEYTVSNGNETSPVIYVQNGSELQFGVLAAGFAGTAGLTANADGNVSSYSGYDFGATPLSLSGNFIITENITFDVYTTDLGLDPGPGSGSTTFSISNPVTWTTCGSGAPSTFPISVYAYNQNPVIGDTIYNSSGTPFPGVSRWYWRSQHQAYRINSTGTIIQVIDCT